MDKIKALIDLFDGATQLGVDVTVFERDVPGAVNALIAWATERGMTVRDNTRVVPDDHPMVEWRGMLVSTVAAGSITVHRNRIAISDTAEGAV